MTSKQVKPCLRAASAETNTASCGSSFVHSLPGNVSSRYKQQSFRVIPALYEVAVNLLPPCRFASSLLSTSVPYTPGNLSVILWMQARTRHLRICSDNTSSDSSASPTLETVSVAPYYRSSSLFKLGQTHLRTSRNPDTPVHAT